MNDYTPMARFSLVTLLHSLEISLPWECFSYLLVRNNWCKMKNRVGNGLCCFAYILNTKCFVSSEYNECDHIIITFYPRWMWQEPWKGAQLPQRVSKHGRPYRGSMRKGHLNVSSCTFSFTSLHFVHRALESFWGGYGSEHCAGKAGLRVWLQNKNKWR